MPDVNQIELKLLESLQQSGKLLPKENAHEVYL